MTRFLRSAFVIARRDFSATVLSKAFIFFLIGPLFPLLLGGVFGSIGATVASQNEQPVAAIIGPKADFDRLLAARQQMAEAVGDGSVVQMVGYAPEQDLAAQQSRLLASVKPSIRAVLTGGIEHPHLASTGGDDELVLNQLRMIISDARQPTLQPVVVSAVAKVDTSAGSLAKERSETALYGQMLLFFLTLLLSGMVLSQLIEEKSNKVIEVIAAAIPIDAMFVGKLFAMLAASVVGLIVWISAGALFIQIVKHGGVQTLTSPAVGWPAFLALAIAYFGMNYLLVGAVFLTIGAQASTSREVQTLSMPATFAQVLVFGFAARSIGTPDSTAGLIAAVFPLSSPMAMLARAAELPDVWPHAAALLWQGLWVLLIVRVGASLFRKTVLKSGPRVRWWKRAERA